MHINLLTEQFIALVNSVQSLTEVVRAICEIQLAQTKLLQALAADSTNPEVQEKARELLVTSLTATMIANFKE